MSEFAETQTQTQSQQSPLDFKEAQAQVRKPWGRLCPFLSTMEAVDLFEPNYLVGRGPNCTININESQIESILNVSREQFWIIKDDEMAYICDASKNGTFVNGVKVGRNKKIILTNDDIIGIGINSKVYTFISHLIHEIGIYPDDLQKKYFVSKQIGRGAFGEVYLAHEKTTHNKYAIKKIHKFRSTSQISNKVKTELDILSTIHHPFVIEMQEIFETDKDVYIVLEYMAGGELNRRIVSALPFPEPEIKFIFYQILIAVRFLHFNGITHRDLKPENVLLSGDSSYPRIKLTDFGLSKILDGITSMETVCGTINYVAPEILNCCESYNKNVDIWSLGVMLFLMLTKTHPFSGEDKRVIARKIISGQISWDPKCWKAISANAKDLVQRALTVNPIERISLSGIFKHHWIDKDHTTKYKVDQFLFATFEETESHSSGELPSSKRPKYE